MRRAQPKRRPTTWPREGLAKIPEAAQFLAVSRSTIYAAIRTGRLKTITVGADQRIPWPELHQLAGSR